MTKYAKRATMTVWMTRVTTIGSAISAICQSFITINAMTRNMERLIVPRVLISLNGSSTPLTSQMLRMSMARSIAPRYVGRLIPRSDNAETM